MNVYVLRDPNDLTIKYVGLTSREVKLRLQVHVKEARGRQRKGLPLNQKHQWILGLLAKGQRPDCICVAANLDKDIGILVEKNLIEICKRECDGGILKNILRGGSYDSDKTTPWNKGLKSCYTEEFIEAMKMSQGHRKEVYRFDKESNYMDKWISIRTMCETLGYDRRTVQRCLSKCENYISHKGFMFSYSIDDIPKLTNKSITHGKYRIING